jgi:valyl-tRNA synthetase|tara:strand:+ start:727 stop:984 length:258 start_codon:yes stop_codon:yes gene_type:complete
MEGLLQYWEQLVFLLGALIVAVKLHTEVLSLRKDVDKLEKDCERANAKIQDNFVSSTRTDVAVKETEKKIESLFQLYNQLRDKSN